MTRNQIKNKIEKNKVKIKELLDINDKLFMDSLLISDKYQQFVEKVEEHPRAKYAREPNRLDGKLIGRIHWKEDFVDEDTGNVITIDRNRIVRIDGEWV